MNRIICIGNRFIQGDDFGPRVYSQLRERAFPDFVQVIDGGIMGLNLLRVFDECERLVFVDSLTGGDSTGEVQVFEGAALWSDETSYSHTSGLGYLLQADLAIRGHSLPQIFLVGVDGQASDTTVAQAADRCAKLVLDQ
jgi:hydrogenase maturation protease